MASFDRTLSQINPVQQHSTSLFRSILKLPSHVQGGLPRGTLPCRLRFSVQYTCNNYGSHSTVYQARCYYADGQSSKLEKKKAALQKDPPTKDTCLKQYVRV